MHKSLLVIALIEKDYEHVTLMHGRTIFVTIPLPWQRKSNNGAWGPNSWREHVPSFFFQILKFCPLPFGWAIKRVAHYPYLLAIVYVGAVPSSSHKKPRYHASHETILKKVYISFNTTITKFFLLVVVSYME